MAHADLSAAVGFLLRTLPAVLFVSACAAAPPPPQAAPPPLLPPPPKTSAGIADREWGTLVSNRFSVRVALPERKAWQIEDQREPWWTARHAASSSELAVKTWRTSRLSKREDCANQIKLWRPHAPNPEAAPESVVDRRELSAPLGYQTELTVGVRRQGGAGEIEGYALAVGHTIGQCYAAIYTTRAVGGNAEATVGERLALFGDAVLPRIERLGVEDRVR
ncbi:MAG: hypothetical protein IPI67_01660 [Myxococcales bacterium]|nr:hypothetical protein [Myxococcales bacterium]